MSEKESKNRESEGGTGYEEHAGKYLTFCLAAEDYGVEILKVQEIIGIMPVTKVPRTPDFVRGVVNLRGKVIPVIDLRSKFGLPEQGDTERTCIIVVQVDQGGKTVTMGIIVDEVSEVMDVTEDQLEPCPAFGSAINTDFINAMGKIGTKVVMLLDINCVLSTEELKAMQVMGSSPS